MQKVYLLPVIMCCKKENKKTKMNFNIYLEDKLGKELEEIAYNSGKSRNALIREAIQFWLSAQTKKEWSKKILEFQGLEESICFEAYREELLPPDEIEVI